MFILKTPLTLKTPVKTQVNQTNFFIKEDFDICKNLVSSPKKSYTLKKKGKYNVRNCILDFLGFKCFLVFCMFVYLFYYLCQQISLAIQSWENKCYPRTGWRILECLCSLMHCIGWAALLAFAVPRRQAYTI